MKIITITTEDYKRNIEAIAEVAKDKLLFQLLEDKLISDEAADLF